MLDAAIVNEAVRLTFEEMAFLDVAGGAAIQPAVALEEGPVLYLEYTRPKVGALALFLPKEVKFQVAESIYGEDWAILSAVQFDDSLLELLNVLAGRLLTARFGANVPYSMGLPTVLYDPPGDMPGYVQVEFPFHVDQHDLLLVWYEVTP